MPDEHLTAGEQDGEQDRPLDPEKLLRLAGVVRGVLEEVRQMDPDQTTSAELAALHERVIDQVAEAVPNMLRKELEAIDLSLPVRNGASAQEVRVAYAGLIGWLGGLFQGLQAALQFQQLQSPAALRPGAPQQVPLERGSQARTGQYL
jgi:hypothetical protein